MPLNIVGKTSIAGAGSTSNGQGRLLGRSDAEAKGMKKSVTRAIRIRTKG